MRNKTRLTFQSCQCLAADGSQPSSHRGLSVEENVQPTSHLDPQQWSTVRRHQEGDVRELECNEHCVHVPPANMEEEPATTSASLLGSGHVSLFKDRIVQGCKDELPSAARREVRPRTDTVFDWKDVLSGHFRDSGGLNHDKTHNLHLGDNMIQRSVIGSHQFTDAPSLFIWTWDHTASGGIEERTNKNKAGHCCSSHLAGRSHSDGDSAILFKNGFCRTIDFHTFKGVFTT
ncbi:unnamed protein product [Pleuronectes platessa]|uniref:Uncharacterized protein n=1 Tax=Pleuronectes platessa TaxID=8262 RepID=A0A9N7VIQ0_PLEPL|nr:unnamed protein product [Pleuronectes platessa]